MLDDLGKLFVILAMLALVAMLLCQRKRGLMTQAGLAAEVAQYPTDRLEGSVLPNRDKRGPSYMLQALPSPRRQDDTLPIVSYDLSCGLDD